MKAMFPIIYLIFVYCTYVSSSPQFINKNEPKIVGGTEVTNRSEFSYQALLLLYGFFPYCGGTLIGEKHVLTAAHCVVLNNNKPLDPTEIFVVLGTLKLYDRTNMTAVQNVYVHEAYDENRLYNDIALLELTEHFKTWTDSIRPIGLKIDETVNGTCVVSGWGTTASGQNQMHEKLLYVEVPIADWKNCNTVYVNLYEVSISETVICAGTGGKHSCQGDSGGPLVCSGKLAGIVSHGYKCAVEGFPGVYTEVAKYIDWIDYYISSANVSSTTSSTTTRTDATTIDDESTSPSSAEDIIQLNNILKCLIFLLGILIRGVKCIF